MVSQIYITLAFVLLLSIGLPIFLVVLSLYYEKKMLKRIESDEAELAHIKVLEVKKIPQEYLDNGCNLEMVCGSIAVAGNYVRNFFAVWKNIFGGEIKSYHLLLNMARRSAMIRMKREAEKLHANCIVNIKYSTANIMFSNTQQGNGTAIEVIVYGTAVISKTVV